jgi:hypothetical protein
MKRFPLDQALVHQQALAVRGAGFDLLSAPTTRTKLGHEIRGGNVQLGTSGTVGTLGNEQFYKPDHASADCI